MANLHQQVKECFPPFRPLLICTNRSYALFICSDGFTVDAGQHTGHEVPHCTRWRKQTDLPKTKQTKKIVSDVPSSIIVSQSCQEIALRLLNVKDNPPCRQISFEMSNIRGSFTCHWTRSRTLGLLIIVLRVSQLSLLVVCSMLDISTMLILQHPL